MIFHSYASDRGLSSHYWNDNSSFPQSRGGGGGGGERGLTSLHQPSPLFLSSSTLTLNMWMLESLWCFPDALALRGVHWQKLTSPLQITLSQSYIHTLFPAAHCLVKETLPWLSRLPAYNPIKQWLTLWTCLLSPFKCQDCLRVYMFVILNVHTCAHTGIILLRCFKKCLLKASVCFRLACVWHLWLHSHVLCSALLDLATTLSPVLA